MLLIGNKSDLEAKRQIDYDTANSYATQNKMKYYETSAKIGYNVDEIFMFLAKEIKNMVVGSPGKGNSMVLIYFREFFVEDKDKKELKESMSMFEEKK